MAISAATLSNINGTDTSAKASGVDDPGSQDRFLKLLVTQLQNQDPLSPMDNRSEERRVGKECRL